MEPQAPPARPLGLLIVTDSLEVGGAEQHVVDLTVALRRRGHNVLVACSVSGSLAGTLEAARIPVRPLLDRLVKRRVSLDYARRLAALVREMRGRGDLDLVHAHVYASAAAAALATLGTGVPLVVTEHTEALWQGSGAQLINRAFCRRARAIISVSSAIRERLLRRDGVPPEKITLIPNAVPPTPPVDGASPLPNGWEEGPLVGVVARLQPEKGVATFLKAVARAAPLFPEARFVVVGDGPLREELILLAERVGVRDRVRFLGFRPDARALLALLDVLVVPSISEGTPLVVLEAMASGVPVVASAVGGIPDQIRDGREGLLVPPGDAVTLGDAVLGLLRDPARARSLGESGRRRAATVFSHSNVVRRVEAVYRTALGHSAPREATDKPVVPE